MRRDLLFVSGAWFELQRRRPAESEAKAIAIGARNLGKNLTPVQRRHLGNQLGRHSSLPLWHAELISSAILPKNADAVWGDA